MENLLSRIIKEKILVLPPAAKNPFEKGFLDLPKLFNWDGLDTIFFFVSLCVPLWLKTGGGFRTAKIHRQLLPPAAKNPFINGLKKLAKKTIFFEMVLQKNDICLTVNRLGSPTPFY